MDKELLKLVGHNIRQVRNERGLYLRDVGELANIHFGHLSEMENGHFDSKLSTLKKIADVLECDIRRFFTPM